MIAKDSGYIKRFMASEGSLYEIDTLDRVNS